MSIHRNPTIEFNFIYGKIEFKSPYLWVNGKSSKPLIDEMNIIHQGRSEAVKRALSDFGIEDSFAQASVRFKEHYHFDLGSSAVDRTTKEAAQQSMEYIEKKISNPDAKPQSESIDNLLIELDGCEIRTAYLEELEDSEARTPVYDNPKKKRIINWRDVRLGFVRPLDSTSKTFVGKMDSYPEIVSDLHKVAVLRGMTPQTNVIGVADGGIGLSEELQRQFQNMIFILDKSHLKDHFYDTADKLGIDKKERTKWVEPQVTSISDGDVEIIINNLKQEYDREPNDRLKRLIGYVTRFSDAINYSQFKDKGYPIGSGEIESAHKSIPQKRLKIPGASWDADSIDPMLSLRILRANKWWEDFWDQRAESIMEA